jgi:alpha-D-xyloside xylohydrolase
LFVRAGPILPMGPLKRYTDEREQGQTKLILCPGDGDEFRLYGDGITSGYQKKDWRESDVAWDDADPDLRSGSRTDRDRSCHRPTFSRSS